MVYFLSTALFSGCLARSKHGRTPRQLSLENAKQPLPRQTRQNAERPSYSFTSFDARTALSLHGATAGQGNNRSRPDRFAVLAREDTSCSRLYLYLVALAATLADAKLLPNPKTAQANQDTEPNGKQRRNSCVSLLHSSIETLLLQLFQLHLSSTGFPTQTPVAPFFFNLSIFSPPNLPPSQPSQPPLLGWPWPWLLPRSKSSKPRQPFDCSQDLSPRTFLARNEQGTMDPVLFWAHQSCAGKTLECCCVCLFFFGRGGSNF